MRVYCTTFPSSRMLPMAWCPANGLLNAARCARQPALAAGIGCIRMARSWSSSDGAVTVTVLVHVR